MKWVETIERLPSQDGSYFVKGKRGRGSIPFRDGKWNEDNTHFQVFEEIEEWLDEESIDPVFSLEDMKHCWIKSHQVTYENTSYDSLAGGIEADYSFIEKERNEWFKKKHNIDL